MFSFLLASVILAVQSLQLPSRVPSPLLLLSNEFLAILGGMPYLFFLARCEFEMFLTSCESLTGVFYATDTNTCTHFFLLSFHLSDFSFSIHSFLSSFFLGSIITRMKVGSLDIDVINKADICLASPLNRYFFATTANCACRSPVEVPSGTVRH